MKTSALFAALLIAPLAFAQGRAPKPLPQIQPAPPPVVTAPAADAPAAPAASAAPAKPASPFVYEQKPLAGRPLLVTPDQAQTIINRFKEAYPKMGSPRILLYVNRELIDEEGGLKLSARSEEVEAIRGDVKREAPADTHSAGKNATPAAAGSPGPLGHLNANALDAAAPKGGVSGELEKVTAKNTYRARERAPLALADKQSIRDIERLFGRPLRMAGATLVDQRVATQLLADKPLHHFTTPTEGEAARKDREALAKYADVVVEILVSSRPVTVVEISGDKTYSVPHIHATAIQLRDSRILGQATSSDLIGEGLQAGKVARNFGTREITEATALSIMEDMLPWN